LISSVPSQPPIRVPTNNNTRRPGRCVDYEYRAAQRLMMSEITFVDPEVLRVRTAGSRPSRDNRIPRPRRSSRRTPTREDATKSARRLDGCVCSMCSRCLVTRGAGRKVQSPPDQQAPRCEKCSRNHEQKRAALRAHDARSRANNERRCARSVAKAEILDVARSTHGR